MSEAKKELARFIIAGCSAVATDTLVYFIFLNFLSPSPSKAISFIAGTIVAFLINKYWTFKQPKHSWKEIIKFSILYATTLGVNVSVNHLTLFILPGALIIAFLAATGTSTVLNFIGQKWWVFGPKGNDQAI